MATGLCVIVTEKNKSFQRKLQINLTASVDPIPDIER